MRSRQVRALASSVLLVVTLSSIPAMAAPGRDDGAIGRFPGIAKAIKRVMNFVLHPLDTLDPPHP
jgi:hypothetical protein